MDYLVVGQRIKAARREKKLTQEGLAEKVGVSVGYINQIERGKKCFNIKRFKELEDILGKPTCYFISGETDKVDDIAIQEIECLLRKSDLRTLKLIKNIVFAIIDTEY